MPRRHVEAQGSVDMLAGLNRAFDAFCLLLSEGGQANGEENDFGFRPAFKTRFSSLTSVWVTLGTLFDLSVLVTIAVHQMALS